MTDYTTPKAVSEWRTVVLQLRTENERLRLAFRDAAWEVHVEGAAIDHNNDDPTKMRESFAVCSYYICREARRNGTKPLRRKGVKP